MTTLVFPSSRSIFLSVVANLRENYPHLSEAMDGDAKAEHAATVREELHDCVDEAADMCSIPDHDDPGVYGPLMELVEENWPSLGDFIEETTE